MIGLNSDRDGLRQSGFPKPLLEVGAGEGAVHRLGEDRFTRQFCSSGAGSMARPERGVRLD